MSHKEQCAEMPYLLESTGDTRDRTAEIAMILQEKGACMLGCGVFYVSGVDMPDHTILRGFGGATRVVLSADVEQGYAVQIGSFCTVSDLTLLGAEEPIELPCHVGERHGILFRGTATPKDWMGPDLKLNSIISGCQIRSFTGGGLTCVDTGYYIRASLTAANCHIINCGAGINIPHFSEYHEFNNMLCCENLYGCINNGGNNVFVNCGFNGNKIGFLIDNSKGQSPNDSHGSMVGCTINHTDNNTGVGVMILGARNGYVFSGCQMFFSRIVLENATGIHFTGMNFGRSTEISIKGGALTMFTDCVFLHDAAFSVENNDAVKLCNCFRRDGSVVAL